MHSFFTSFAGRNYEVVVHPELRKRPMNEYAQVYRLRKDGSRGLHLQAHRNDAWNVWSTVRDQANALDVKVVAL